MNFNQQHGHHQTPTANPSANLGYNGDLGDTPYPQDGSHLQHLHGFPDTHRAGQRPQMTSAYGQQYAQAQTHAHAHAHAQYPQDAYMNAQYAQLSAVYPQPSPTTYSLQPMVVIPQRSPEQTNSNSRSSPIHMSTTPPNFHHPNPDHYQYYHHASSSLQQPPQRLLQHQPLWQNYNEHYQGLQAQTQTQAQGLHYTQHAPHPPPSTLQSTPQQRPVPVTSRLEAMVEIPVQPPRYPQNPPQQPQQRSSHAAPMTSSSFLPHLSTPVTKRSAPPTAPPVDYQQLLLLLAEDYINAAHGMGSLVAFYRRTEDLKQYYTLMATGLSCIEASLTQFRLAPQAEASLVLQYCNIVFHETENYDEVDKWLSKAIPLCERNKLLDIKYSMHHLSARALFTTNPRVALKSLDTLIPITHAYKHVPWVYALRFLRVSFSLKLGASHQDLTSASQNLKAISDLASHEDDAAIGLLCATYEALLHLRSMTANCVEEAQRAIAAAKSFQLHPLAKSLSQIWALLNCLEVMCYLMEGNPAMAAQKAEQMAPLMDDIRANPSTGDDGLLLIPLDGNVSPVTDNTCGIFRRVDEKDYLVFQWLPRRDLWAFCFLLNAITAQARTFADQKTEVYLREGLKILRENLSDTSLSRDDILSSSAPLNSTIERLDWWHNMRWFLHIYMATNATSHGGWTKAQEYLSDAQGCPAVSSVNNAQSRAKWETFLRATILQGTGQTNKALSIYQSPILRLPATTTHKLHDIETDLSILSILNSILITLDPSHPAHSNAIHLHELVSPLLVNHPNKSLGAAHNLLRSVLNPHDKLIDKKKHFANCLNAARAVNNTQLVSIALTLMCTMFFKDVVGEQAQKSVKSARALADRSGSLLWRSVAAGLQQQTAKRHGNEADAERARETSERLTEELPDMVKMRFMLKED